MNNRYKVVLEVLQVRRARCVIIHYLELRLSFWGFLSCWTGVLEFWWGRRRLDMEEIYKPILCSHLFVTRY